MIKPGIPATALLGFLLAIQPVTGLAHNHHHDRHHCDDKDCPDDTEQEIPLENVPPNIIAAAIAAVRGIELKSAEIEVEDGRTVYELEGTVDGTDYEIEISPDGKVLDVDEER